MTTEVFRMKRNLTVLTMILICVCLIFQTNAFAAMSDEDFLKLCESGTAQEVARAIKSGANVNASDRNGRTALMVAARYNLNPETVSTLVNNGADINAGNNKGWTALMFAAWNKSTPEIVSVLLKNGANAAIKNREGKIAIDYASANANLINTDVYQQLLAASNAGTSIPEQARQSTAISDDEFLELCASGTPQEIEAAIKDGANVNAIDEYGETPLMIAARSNRDPEVISVLLQNGADASIKDNEGMSAVDYASVNARIRNTDAYQQLIAASNVDSVNSIEEALRIYIDYVNDYVNEVRNNEKYLDEYGNLSLIYIDNDDIPELVIVGPSAAYGTEICTISDGELVYTHLGIGGVSYIERQNIFVVSGGRMGNYYDTVYSIQNGEFQILNRGEYGDEETNDEESLYIYYWRWDGEEVTESEYSEKLKLAFDDSKAINSDEDAFRAADMLQKVNELLRSNSSQSTRSDAPSISDEDFLELCMSGTPQEIYPGEVLYYGVSLSQFLGEPKQKWIDTFGEPDWEHDWYLMYEGRFAPIFNSQEYPYEIYSIVGITPSMVEVNGVSLDKTRIEMIDIFGEPSSEYYDEGYGDTWTYGYNYTYDIGRYSFTVTFEDTGGKPYAISVSDNASTEITSQAGDTNQGEVSYLDWLVSNGHVPQYVQDRGAFHYDSNFDKVRITGNNVRLRSQPNLEARIIDNVSNGEILTYHGEWTHPQGEKWLIAGYDAATTETFVWVHSDFSEPITQEQYAELQRGRSNSISGITYKGYPISWFFLKTVRDLVDVFGSPSKDGYSKDGYGEGFGYYGYDRVYFVFYEGEITLIEVHNPGEIEISGVSLEKNRAELIEIFGSPTYEGLGEDESHGIEEHYFLSYGGPGYSMAFRMPSREEKVNAIDFIWNWDDEYSENYDDGPSEEEYNISVAGSFRRADYLKGITKIDLLRYPDRHLYSKVFFGKYQITQVLENKIYLARNSISLSPENDYIIIDARGFTGANALVRDFVSVYGIFHGINTIDWRSGGSDQVPVIAADLLIFNHAKPNLEEFAEAIPANMNANLTTYGSESQYLGGTKVKLLASLDPGGTITIVDPALTFGVNISRELGIPAIAAGNIDGYYTFIKFDLASAAVEGIENIGNRDNDLLVFITGNVTELVPNVFDPATVNVSIKVEKIEKR